MTFKVLSVLFAAAVLAGGTFVLFGRGARQRNVSHVDEAAAPAGSSAASPGRAAEEFTSQREPPVPRTRPRTAAIPAFGLGRGMAAPNPGPPEPTQFHRADFPTVINPGEVNRFLDHLLQEARSAPSVGADVVEPGRMAIRRLEEQLPHEEVRRMEGAFMREMQKISQAKEAERH
jgi:hypothetical protein